MLFRNKTEQKKKASSDVAARFASDQDFESLKELVESLMADGDLSYDDIDDITLAADELSSRGMLSRAQRQEIFNLIRQGARDYGKTHVRLALKIGAIVVIVAAMLLIPVCVREISSFVHLLLSGESIQTTVELVLSIIQLALLFVSAATHIVLAVFLLRNKRYGGSRVVIVLMTITILGIANSIMLNGVSESVLFLTIILIIQCALSVYLSPTSLRERRLSKSLRMVDTKTRAEDGTLGLDLEGKGYIKLDFFNIFWVFIGGCLIGITSETIFHMVVIEPGVFQYRAGLMWGPFSPIYGIGCVLMTISLNRFKNANVLVVFLVCTLVGGVFEYVVSWWLEIAWGVDAWNYSDQFLNIQGRTCLLYASMFGLLGLGWIKIALPFVLKTINRIPWKIRYTVTTMCAALMLVDCVVTVEALDCWYERLCGKEVTSDVQVFYAEHFPDDVMHERFQGMAIRLPDGTQVV